MCLTSRVYLPPYRSRGKKKWPAFSRTSAGLEAFSAGRETLPGAPNRTGFARGFATHLSKPQFPFGEVTLVD